VEIQESTFLPIEMLQSGAAEMGIKLDEARTNMLDQFARMLVDTNQTLNLTRITEPEQIITGHYFDSFTCLAIPIRREARVIDIGSGAGFPGIPMKIVRPDLDLTLLDSSRKKLGFLDGAIERLGLDNIQTLHIRAEDAGRDGQYREAYDVAVTRALADMKILAELCLPLIKVGGMLIAQKSDSAIEEIEAARAHIGQLGGRIEKVKAVIIPKDFVARRLVVVTKIRPTPSGFPRAFSRIKKSKP
jgi:16S rRNA (guanine527-N7)-methyltransferase